MSPRRYRMAVRRDSIDSTRRRIVAAASKLHARKGVVATSWDDIASEAGVSRATVYHHYASLDQLIPACAQVAFDLVEVPTPEDARRQFASLRTPRARLAYFVKESCRCYAAGADWLRAAWRERDLVPQMRAAVEKLHSALDVLLPAVVEGVELDQERRRVLGALLDFPFWDSLRRSGMPEEEIEQRILALIEFEIGFRRSR